MPGNLFYGKSVLIAFDQLVNALADGWPDETLSSRAWRWSVSGKRDWPRKIIDTLFFLDRDAGKGHCELSCESERLGRQLPPELRSTTRS